MSCWNPEQYLTFECQRTRPAQDLADKLNVQSPHRIIDLGCGPGNSTTVLTHRWPNADVIGLDNSRNMITRAQEQYPSLNWIIDDISCWKSTHTYDIIFSNAALHWVPNHRSLIPELFSHLSTAGALAVQIPYRLESKAHQVMLSIADCEDWRDRTANAVAGFTNETPAFYYNLLRPVASQIDLWVTEYHHTVPSVEFIVDWLRTTGLRPILDELNSDTDREKFENLLLERYRDEFIQCVDGQFLFALPRLFFIAYNL